MKTAVIILPSLGKDIAPEGYLSICAGKVQSKGYTLLHSANWESYKQINFHEFINRMNPCIDSFFLFVDYGVSALIINIVEQYYRSGLFSKEINIEINTDHPLSLYGILVQISELSKIPLELLKAKTRKCEIVEPRQLYFKRAKEVTNYSLTAIGSLVGKDHATVIHGVRKVNNDDYLSKLYDAYFNGRPYPRKKEKFIVKGKYNPLFERQEQKKVKLPDPVKAEVIASMPHSPEKKFVAPFAGHPERVTYHHGFREHQL